MHLHPTPILPGSKAPQQSALLSRQSQVTTRCTPKEAAAWPRAVDLKDAALRAPSATTEESPHHLLGSPRLLGMILSLLSATLSQTRPLHAQTPQLQSVFTQMDAASKRFQAATADVERDNYERVVHDTTKQKGTLYIDRARGGMEFGATVADLDPSGKAVSTPARVVTYSNGTLQMYTPAEHQVDVFKSGANQGKLEGYFALGFGGTSQDLQSSWNITDAGPETLSDNGQPVKTEKLVLVSKDPAAQNTFRRITLWLDPTRDVSLKQLFETPSGDTQTAFYSNIHLNPKLNKAVYKIPTGKGTTVVNH